MVAMPGAKPAGPVAAPATARAREGAGAGAAVAAQTRPGPPGPPRTQSAAGLEGLFKPRSIALIGASPRPGGVGHRILANLLRDGYTGKLYAVHPSAPEVLGIAAVPSVAHLPEVPDLAVVAVPSHAVVEVADACGSFGVRCLVVVTAGFGESGGSAAEAALRTVLDRHGMRMVGPNCLGVVNPAPALRMNASFAPDPVPFGATAVATQSGALGIAILEEASRMGMGIARFASMGNKLDVSSNDLLLLWEDDPEVRQVLLYLESFGNPRNFVAIAGRVGRSKPILAVKSGRSASGARAAGSHTGALAQPDRIVDATFEQAGVLRLDGAEELFDVARAVELQPLPAGPRVAILTNSGGPAILAADALAAHGLELAVLSQDTRQGLASALPPEASCTNPVDMLASAGPEQFRFAHRTLGSDPGVDALLAIYTPVTADDRPVVEALREASTAAPLKPTLVNLFGRAYNDEGPLALRRAGLPAFRFPENAVRALAGMHRLATYRSRPVDPPVPDLRLRSAVEPLLADAAPGWLPQSTCLAIMAACGIPVPAWRWVTSAAETVEAARSIRAPFVLKAEADGLVHKTDAGGVRLGLPDAAAAAEAYTTMQAAVAHAGFRLQGALLMEQAPPAPEFLVGCRQEPGFGAVVAVAAGGVEAELWDDVALRLAPVTQGEAGRMVAGLRASARLVGWRGAPACDTPALQRAVEAMGQLGAVFPQVAEVEANPVRVYASGVLALDARLRITAA